MDPWDAFDLAATGMGSSRETHRTSIVSNNNVVSIVKI